MLSVNLPTTVTAPAKRHVGMNISRNVEPSRGSARRPVRMSGKEMCILPEYAVGHESNENYMGLTFLSTQLVGITISHSLFTARKKAIESEGPVVQNKVFNFYQL